MQVAYGSAFAHFLGQTSHDMLIPPGYASISVEEICQPQFEDLEIDIPGGDGERTLKDAVHGIIVDGIYSCYRSSGLASGQILCHSQGTLLPSSDEPKVSNLWNKCVMQELIY
jgi:hypothetical protein